ncbi:MAG: hypothetical protein AAFO94_04825 [Bacteroidota bacterium]
MKDCVLQTALAQIRKQLQTSLFKAGCEPASGEKGLNRTKFSGKARDLNGTGDVFALPLSGNKMSSTNTTANDLLADRVEGHPNFTPNADGDVGLKPDSRSSSDF